MKILGIHTDYHDTGAAVIVDGKPVAAVSEERYTRKKMDGAFPYHSITRALEIAGLKEADFDLIAFSGSAPGFRKMHHFFKDQNSRIPFTRGKSLVPNLSITPYTLGRLLRQSGLTSGYEAFKIGQKVNALIKDFRNAGFSGKIEFFEHDYCHAAGAYFSAGFSDALVCIIEGSSFVNSASFWEGKDGNLKKIDEMALPHSVGRYYELVTLILGFNPKKHGGKITGLAAFGDPKKLYAQVSELLFLKNGELRISPKIFVWYEEYIKNKKIPAPFKDHTKEDIAAAFQKRMEDVVVAYITQLRTKYPHKTIVLSGGVASNVKLNMEIMHIPGVEHVVVHPPMSDVGQAFGAALAGVRMMDKDFRPFALQHAYLGDSFEREAILKVLEKKGVIFSEPHEYASEVAKLLAEKKTVALFHGGMEYGPRALGNRSILYSAEDKSVNEWLNKQLNRTEFMPFAPVTLAERALDCYDHDDVRIAGDSLKFMTMTVRVAPAMKERMSAAVHVDGTARPQLVDRTTNALYYDILKAYEGITGLPTLVNTSFNMHEEPIVCTPEEALIAYEQSNLDALAVYPFLVRRSDVK